MSEDESTPLRGSLSEQHVNSLLVNDSNWFRRHKNNYVAMGSATKLASETTAEDAARVGQQVAQEKDVRLDYLVLINQAAREDAIASRKQQDNSGDLSL